MRIDQSPEPVSKRARHRTRGIHAMGVLAGIFNFAAALLVTPNAPAQETFLRGDSNADGRVSTADSMFTRRFLFSGGTAPTCFNAADMNDSGNFDLSDAIDTINFLFRDGAAPPAPFPEPGDDPTENFQGFGCESYVPVPPEQTEDTAELGEVVGAPGTDVEIPVFVDSSRDIEAFQLVIAYDPALFRPTEGLQSATAVSLEGTYYEGAELRFVFVAVKAFPEEGVFRVGFVPDLIYGEHALPAHTSEAAFKFRGRIPDDAPVGAVAELTPTNGDDGSGHGIVGMKNELTYQGDARLIVTEPLLVPGFLEIVGDQIFFRGDANDDGTVDISDAQFTLDFLFLGGPAPNCEDAADANDDGMLNIADPVATLQYLFHGASELPVPSSSRGFDPTSDDLGCVGESR